MTLVELLVALLLTALLLLGLVQFATAAGASQRLLDNQARLQDQARSAFRMLAGAIAEAGFDPSPWTPGGLGDGIGERTADALAAGSDRLTVRAWSDRNCFDNLNPVAGPDGRPAFHLRESSFDRNDAGYLTRECRYGPSAAELVTQVRRQGRVPGVESFQLLFGEDRDRDGNVDRWVRAGNWQEPRRILALRVGLLLRGDDPVAEPVERVFPVLDETVQARPDGRLRDALEFTVALRGAGG
jgi:type II secretory pathway pseudopilin PulG